MPPDHSWMYWAILSFVLLCLLIAQAIQHRRSAAAFRKKLQTRTAELEQQVEKTKVAASAKSNFLSRMSHEIRTPLNAIMGMVQLLRSSPDPSRFSSYMGTIEESSRHLLGVINDILDYTKIESGNMVFEENSFSLNRDIDFIRSLFSEKIKAKQLELSVKLTNVEHDGVVADKLRLNQVLINLLSNAVKFTDAGGRIWLSVEELAHIDSEGVFRFAVRDNGVGIEQEQAKKLFTPFTQAFGVSRVYGGTGLGLSISQSIVRMMGGEIELETSPGKGAVFEFTVRMPATRFALEEQSSDCAVPVAKLEGKRILIVDDVAINRDIVAALLEGSGAKLETASNGKEALDAYCAAEPYRYALILMDMLMPVMDGCDATRRIRASGRKDAEEIKIVAMTANVLQEDMERAYQAGMNGFLTKPVEMEVLFSKLEEWL